MNQSNVSITVIGAGSYGTALVIILIRDSHQVVLWGHDPKHITTLECDRCSVAFLPDAPFPDTLRLESDLATAPAASHNILVAVPSHVFGGVLYNIKPLMCFDVRLVWAVGGPKAEAGRPPQGVACEALGDSTPLMTTSGPTFAKESATDMPTTISLASTDDTFAGDPQQLPHCDKSSRIYSNPDFAGVQFDGATKGVIAIGARMSDGIGSGANARTALITRGLIKMFRLGAALGADPVTFMGMASLDDLMLTCTNNQSRSRRFGMMFDQGMNMRGAQDGIGQVVEDYRSTREVRELTHRSDAKVLVTGEVYQVSHCRKGAREATLMLLGRARRDELSRYQL